jgi:hypothetical protein
MVYIQNGPISTLAVYRSITNHMCSHSCRHVQLLQTQTGMPVLLLSGSKDRTRVTSLAEFSPIWVIVYFENYETILKIINVAYIFGLLLPRLRE